MTDSNWLTPEPNDQNEAVPASGLTAHTIEPAPTVAATPLEKQNPSSAWVILALVGGVIGLAMSCLALTLIPFAFIQPLTTSRALNTTATAVVSFISISGVGLLGAPLAWYALQRLRHQAIAMWRTDWFWVVVSGIIIALMLIAGQIILFFKLFAGMVGVLQYVATVLAALILLSLTAGNWDQLSQLRVWSHLASGAWLSVPIAFVIEIILIALGAVVVSVILSIFAPAESTQLQRLFQLYQRTRNPALFNAWLLKPWVIGLGFVTLSLLLPAIEELCKPLGVILMLKRKPTPMAAFIGGVLGGLGFAMVETLGNLTSIGDVWLVTITARFGTMVMHALTTGIVGWGLGQWAAHRSWWNLIRSYAGAIIVHGIWNGAVITMVFIGVRFANNPNALRNITSLSIFGVLIGFSLLVLIVLALGGLIALGGIGRHLRTPAPK